MIAGIEIKTIVKVVIVIFIICGVFIPTIINRWE